MRLVTVLLTVALGATTITSSHSQSIPPSSDPSLEGSYTAEFHGCQADALRKYDDHKSDPDLIADVVVASCGSIYDKIIALRTTYMDTFRAAVFRQSAFRGVWTSVRQIIVAGR